MRYVMCLINRGQSLAIHCAVVHSASAKGVCGVENTIRQLPTAERALVLRIVSQVAVHLTATQHMANTPASSKA